MEAHFLNRAQVEAGLAGVLAAPKDNGILEAIFLRPAVGERRALQEGHLSPEEGLVGDRWSWSRDGRPEPRAQVSLMNARVLDLIAGGDRKRWALAGDNLIVDLDLSEENLEAGQRLKIGQVLVEVTDLPHTGCEKFVERYGPEAASCVNGRTHQHLRLRGLFVRVLEPGIVRVGDRICKV
jgi:MOSC domain-containing protein YiiM